MAGRLILFSSLPKVGGHSTLTYGLCRLLRPHYDEIEVWCKTMPEHGFSPKVADSLAQLGCRVIRLNDDSGRMNWPALAKAVWSAWMRRPEVFFALAMRHLSVGLAATIPARKSIYYHITHDLNAGTIRRLHNYARVFCRMVFICPATYDEFPGAVGDARFAWAPQSSEIPVNHPDRLEAERRAHGGETVRFGLLGRLTTEKGSAAIAEYLDRAAFPCELHVAGSGPFAETFSQRAAQPSGKVRVHFHGAYDPSERAAFLRAFFARIDFLLVPSQDEWETLSMATLESLQYGVPAVLCRTGGLKSFAHPDLGPAADDVVRLVAPADLAHTLDELAAQPRPNPANSIAACRTYYEKFFSDAAVAGRWQEILRTQRFTR